MLISILFIISSIILIIDFLLIKKSDNKLNIIKWLFISLILIFCFNSLIVYILSYISISSNLLSMSSIYLLISIFVYLKFLKNNKQKYYFNKKDLIYLFILLLVVVIISFIRFGFPLSITYKTLDPAVHFQSAYSFYKESFLLNFVQDKTIFNFETWRFASYTNLGLIFKFFSPFITENNFYNVYILYDILTLFITAVLFYYLINNESKGIIKLLGTILFLLGYPLNNLLIGFFYVGHATCIIVVIMLVVKELKPDNLMFFLLFILNIGLTFTYYLFIPFVFLDEFIYFFKTKHMIKKYFVIFVIPLLLGFIYFILPTFSNNDMNLINQTRIDGYFYNDVFGNLLLFLPIISYYFYYKFKEKKLDFELIMFLGLFILMIILNICMLTGLIMPYYVSKYYYILWILCFVILFRTYDDYYEKDKFIFKNYAVFMLFTIVLSISNIENKIIDLNTGEWNRTTPNMLFNVYNYNLYLINEPTTVFTSEEIEDIKSISNKIDNNFLTNTEPERIMWLINFIQKDKIDCPINQVYDCLKEKYYIDITTYLNNYDDIKLYDKNYIFFSRSIYWRESIVNADILNIINSVDNSVYKLYDFKSGFIISR